MVVWIDIRILDGLRVTGQRDQQWELLGRGDKNHFWGGLMCLVVSSTRVAGSVGAGLCFIQLCTPVSHMGPDT